MESLPDNLKEIMGGAWRLKQKNQQILEQQGKK